VNRDSHWKYRAEKMLKLFLPIYPFIFLLRLRLSRSRVIDLSEPEPKSKPEQESKSLEATSDSLRARNSRR